MLSPSTRSATRAHHTDRQPRPSWTAVSARVANLSNAKEMRLEPDGRVREVLTLPVAPPGELLQPVQHRVERADPEPLSLQPSVDGLERRPTTLAIPTLQRLSHRGL